MNNAEKESLARIKEEINSTPVSRLAKEAALDAVNLSAQAANGVEDANRIKYLAKAVYAGNILGARTLIEVGDLRRQHEDAVKKRADAQPPPVPTPEALWERILIRVKPVAWPIAVVGAAGQLPQIIEAIRRVILP